MNAPRIPRQTEPVGELMAGVMIVGCIAASMVAIVYLAAEYWGFIHG